MVAKEINPDKLVSGLAVVLKEKGTVNPPQWSEFVKTGAHVERPPENPDWWYVRAASVLRQVYMRGPVGVGKLRNWYGGRKKRGSRPERHQKAGGKIIRTCLQQLEAAGLIAKEGSGRKITSRGQSIIDTVAASLKPRIEKKPTPKTVVKKAPVKKAPSKKASAKKPASPAEAAPAKVAAKKPTKDVPAKAKPTAVKSPNPKKPAAKSKITPPEKKAKNPVSDKQETPAKKGAKG